MTRGFIYCATGEKYLTEAIGAAKSLKAIDPLATIAVFTDLPVEAAGAKVFDEIHVLEDPAYNYRDKIAAIIGSPFEKTVFLDTDTRVLTPVNDLFQLLDRFPFLICHAPKQRHFMKTGQLDDVVPAGFPQVNSGVIGFTRSDEVAKLVKEWERIYADGSDMFTGDQGALTHALWFGDIAFYILPPEYNFRPHQIAVKNALSSVKIIHSRWLIRQGEKAVSQFAAALDDFKPSMSWDPYHARLTKLPSAWHRHVSSSLQEITVAGPDGASSSVSKTPERE